MGLDGSISEPTAISVRSVTKRYGTTTILDDVSLAVEPGELVTLLGPSGSGKTTLLNIIAGFTQADGGEVLFGSENVTRKPPHQRGIGIVFQNYALFPHMSVADNVAFPLRARKLPKKEISDSVSWALSLVKLAGYGDRRIDQLSGGQKQRVALARAIVFRPRLILMDEPLSALDKQLREHMQIEIRALHETLGATSIYVTHDQREALTLSHRVAILNKGKIAQYASPEDVYDRPADAFVADFIGEGTLVPVERAGTDAISLAGNLLKSPHPIPAAHNLKLVIRSEKLRLASSPSDVNTFPAQVRSIVFQGDSYLVLAETAQGLALSLRLVTHAEGAHVPRPGDLIALQLHPEHTYVVTDPRS